MVFCFFFILFCFVFHFALLCSFWTETVRSLVLDRSCSTYTITCMDFSFACTYVHIFDVRFSVSLLLIFIHNWFIVSMCIFIWIFFSFVFIVRTFAYLLFCFQLNKLLCALLSIFGVTMCHDDATPECIWTRLCCRRRRRYRRRNKKKRKNSNCSYSKCINERNGMEV